MHQRNFSVAEFASKNFLGEIHWENFSSGWATFFIPDTTKYILEKVAKVEKYIL